MPENWQRAGFGIYIHWPFCAAKCPYCDFNSHVVDSVDQSDWQTAFLSEIKRYGAELPGRVVSSVFFGGGTPSLMEPQLVGAILEAISAQWTLANDVEVTLEANPTSVEAGRFSGYRDAGVNRVSVGVQALNDTDLRALGRLHSMSEALSAIKLARDVFDRVSFDLIYARQHQSLSDWQDELHRALAMEPDHLSLYQLTIENGTAFGDRYARGLLKGLPDEDLGADLYFATQEICNAHGLPTYEVSNHAKTGQESRHNQIYWRSGDWIGIGPGAHGRITVDQQRISTETALMPSLWLESALTGIGESKRETLSAEEVFQEKMLMGLRLDEGVEVSATKDPRINHIKINELSDIGLVSLEHDRLRVTPDGRPVLNRILRDILTDG
ncbi:radical SAM family heme chaperone HemW [Candidatus Rhodobacter oscarellae]|uniref:radical SAM family heme chaperone HemW n=1 Tax=Candidatus Rhodobacter oscarellae TaxID=1675527 RepID=UPI000670EC18|nr:radical SAM family heme chaperone HemW [Candidatus Rhodobacter lobularis]